jgi:hypothetical protein
MNQDRKPRRFDMQNRKPPFVHCARSPEQQTSAPVQVPKGNILERVSKLLGGSVTIPPGPDITAPIDEVWDAER